MILPFKVIHNGQPTYFMEKMLRSLAYNLPVTERISKTLLHADFAPHVVASCKPKKHTFRQDKKNRWKAGSLIHPVIHNRSKKMFQFLDTTPVVSVQQVEIKYTLKVNELRAAVLIDGVLQGEAVWVNCKLKVVSTTIEVIAENDGFETVMDFFNFFPEYWTGKIIHWTDLRY